MDKGVVVAEGTEEMLQMPTTIAASSVLTQA